MSACPAGARHSGTCTVRPRLNAAHIDSVGPILGDGVVWRWRWRRQRGGRRGRGVHGCGMPPHGMDGWLD